MCKEDLKHEHCHQHTHEHSHEHTHEHSHDHHHEHCECAADASVEKQQKTLKILISHWIDHNKSHEDGFREWVEKCNNMDKKETAKYIEKAIEYMEKANDMLKEAGENI